MTIFVVVLLLLAVLPGEGALFGGEKEKYKVTVFTEKIVRDPKEEKVGTGKKEEKLEITLKADDNPYTVLVRELTAKDKVYHGKIIYEMRTASLKNFNPKKDIMITQKTTAKAFYKESTSRAGANPISIYVILGVKVPVYKLARATAASEYQMTQLGNETILLRQPLDDFHNIWSKVQKLVDEKHKGLLTDDLRVIKKTPSGEMGFPLDKWYIESKEISKLILVQNPEVSYTVPVYLIKDNSWTSNPIAPGNVTYITSIILKQNSLSLRSQRYVWDSLLKDSTMADTYFEISNLFAKFQGVQKEIAIEVDYKGVDVSKITELYFDKALIRSYSRLSNFESTWVYRFKEKGKKKRSHSIDLGKYATGKNILKQIRRGIIGGIRGAVLAVKPNGKGLDLIHDDLNVYKIKVFVPSKYGQGIDRMPSIVAFTNETLKKFSAAIAANPGYSSITTRHYPYYRPPTNRSHSKKQIKYKHGGQEESFMEEVLGDALDVDVNLSGAEMFNHLLGNMEDNGLSTSFGEGAVDSALGNLSIGGLDLGDLGSDLSDIGIDVGSLSEDIDLGGGSGGGGDGGGGDGGGDDGDDGGDCGE